MTDAGLWLIRDGGYIHTPACDWYIYLGDDKLAFLKGYALQVGPGTGISQLIYCNHYHDHEHVNEMLDYKTERTTLYLKLGQSTPAAPLKPAARIMIDSLVGNITTDEGYKMRVEHTFDEDALLVLIRMWAHMHAYAHHQDKVVAWITNARTGTEKMIANASISSMNTYLPLPDRELVLNKSDTLILECYFKRDVRFPASEWL